MVAVCSVASDASLPTERRRSIATTKTLLPQHGGATTKTLCRGLRRYSRMQLTEAPSGAELLSPAQPALERSEGSVLGA
jgi:hypothetical protein